MAESHGPPTAEQVIEIVTAARAEAIEDIARWLEQYAPGDGWSNRRRAEDLRTDRWRDHPERRTDAEVAWLRADDKITFGLPLTELDRVALALGKPRKTHRTRGPQDDR
jgi:hypothetical protein